MILITNAYLVNPATGDEGYFDILTEGERILRIAPDLYKELSEKQALADAQEDTEHTGSIGQDGAATEEADTAEEEIQVIDGTGLICAPGLVDVHSHFRDPGFTYKEDIYTGAKAAARGGYTTIVLMANTRPCGDNPETLSYVLSKGAETDIHIHTCCTVTEGMAGEKLTDMDLLYDRGAAGFTDDGVPILNEELVRAAMKKVAELDVPISFHEENPAYIKNNGVNTGKASEHYGIGGSPRQAEIDLVGRDLQIAMETGAHIDIQHISSKEAVELVRRAKAVVLTATKGQSCNIHAEATPHHFALTEDAVITYGTMAKMNPPLRTEEDRLAIIEGLKDGTIDLIATDHAPHSAEEKQKPITEAPSGILGLETALPLAIMNLVDAGHLSMQEMLAKLTVNPARLYHLDAGYLAEDGPADIVLFDPGEEYTVTDFASKSANSPFLNWKMKGKVKYTICKGKVVYSEEE